MGKAIVVAIVVIVAAVTSLIFKNKKQLSTAAKIRKLAKYRTDRQ